MNIIFRTMVVCILLCGLALIGGCGESNPLIGKWEGLVNDVLPIKMEFTSNTIISSAYGGTGVGEVSKYDIQGKKVIVLMKDGSGSQIDIIDPDTIKLNGMITLKKLK